MKFLAVGVLCASIALAADIGVIEEIVAKVNGDIITRTELDKGRRQLEAEIRQKGLKGDQLQKELADREKQSLGERIDQLLLVQRGKELSVNVDSEVTRYMADLQRKSGIAEPEKFQAYLREQTGQPYEDYKNEVRNSFLTRRVIGQEVGSKINVPEAELKKYYDEHKNEFMRQETVFLRELLVSTDGKDEKQVPALEKKAKDIVARARKGERFSDLIRDNSDATSKQEGGDLGGFKRGELNKQIEEVVFKNDRGYITDPFRVPNGFLILRVEEKFKAGQAEFDEVKNEIMERLYMPRMQPAVREYLTKLRQDAFLEIKPNYVDAYAANGKDTAWKDPAQLKPETVTKEEVSAKGRHKRLLWVMPIPGTSTSSAKAGTSKSR